MKSLYRRYRPTRLSEVVGQEQVTEVLAAALKAGKISHAYLFIGPRGTGKTSVARIFAHEVNGFDYQIEDDYVDIIEIDGASNRGIDNIRELREKAAIAPTAGKYKIYIIDEVHMLTKEAFNALLKTLEEPPAHVIFIMATTDAYKVPVTITSRAQTYTFRLANAEVMLAHLKSICEKEQIKISDEALKIIVKRGGGSFRDSLSLLDQISTLSDGVAEISKDDVIRAMGLPEDEKITELLADFTAGDVVKITTVLKELLSSGIKPETLAEEMIGQIIADPKPELLPLLAKLPEVKAPFAEAKLMVALFAVSEHRFLGSASSPSMSYTGPPAEPPLRGEPVGVGRNIHLGRANRTLSRKSDVPDASTDKNDSGSAEVPEKAGLPNSGRADRRLYQENDNPAKLPKVEPPTPTNINFNWDEFTQKVKSLNDAVYSQLMKTSHEVNGNTLDIYPERKVLYNILSKDANKRILVDAAGGVRVVIHEVGEKPTGAAKDALLSRISDIMGGEVKNDGGDSPF